MTETPSLYPPKWHPDPFGRFQWRYYDGLKWTEWVSNHGHQMTDPPVSDETPPLPGAAAVQQAVVVQQIPPTNSNAITSLVLAILFLGGLGSLLAILVGSQAQKQIKETGERGDGLAQAGILLGMLGVIGAVVMWWAIYQASQQTCSPYSYSC